MRHSKWKSVLSWLLVIAMLGSYANTALAVESTETAEVTDTAEITEPADTAEEIVIEPNYETAESGNPFMDLLDASGEGAGISTFRFGQFETTFYDQLEDPLTREIYGWMEDTFIKQKKNALEYTKLQNPVTFTATIEESSLVKDEAYKEAVAQTVQCFNVAFGAFYRDHPEAFWIYGMNLGMKTTAASDGKGGHVGSVSLISLSTTEYYTDAWNLVSDYQAAVQAAKAEIEAEAGGTSRYELAKGAHDWLCRNLTYNTEAANNMGNEAYRYAHTSVTSFLGYQGDTSNKSVVCEGYAKAFKVLCDQWGIPCVLVSGMGGNVGSQGPHMWNYVQMEDGKWYGVDATWDDQGAVIYDSYFLSGSSTVGFRNETFGEQHLPDAALAKDEQGNNLYAFVYPVLEEGKYVYGNADEPIEYDWKLESGTQIYRFASQEEIAAKLADFNNTKVRISCEAETQPSVIPGEILKVCAEQALELEYLVTEESTNTICIWNFRGLFYAEGETAEDFSLRVDILTEDEALPAKLREGAYVKVAVEGTLPTCESASLTVQKEGIAASLAGRSTVYEWGQTAAGLEYRKRTEISAEEASELQISLGQGVSAYIWSIYLGTTENQENGTWLCISDADLGEPLTEQQITEILQNRAKDTSYTDVLVTRIGTEITELSKRIPASWVSAASQLLAEDGRLNLRFWDQTTGEITWWTLTNPVSTENDKDGMVTVGKGEDGSWRLILSDSGFSAETTSVRYSSEALTGANAFENQQKLYYFPSAGDEALAEGSYVEASDAAFGTRSFLVVDSVEKLESRISYIISHIAETETYGWTKIEDKICYLDLETGKRVTGWDIIDGVKCYFDKDGYLAEGPACINGVWYLFGNYAEKSFGILTGCQKYQGKSYYADAEGVLQTGWQRIGDNWRYFLMGDETCGEELPTEQTGNWVRMKEEAGEAFAGRRYYFKNNKTLLKGWQTIDGKQYLFLAGGYVKTGWYSDGKNTYYLDEQEADRGVLLKGIQRIGENTYYFNTKGVLQYGWQKLDGEWRYFSKTGGSEQKVTITPEYWVTIEDGGRFYLKNGTAFAKGWQTINGEKYYFDSEGRLLAFTALENNWYELDGERYYFTGGKKLAIGWQTINKKKYYFDTDGRMQTGEFEVKGKYYRTWDDPKQDNYGSICTGWQTIDGETYYFSSSGQCASGLTTINKQKFCFDEHGKMLVGRQTIKDKDYYFMDGSEVSEVMLPTGSLQKGLIETGDGSIYYTGSKEYLLSGWQKINGKWHYFDETTKKELEVREEAPRSGWQTIDGEKYYFNSRGEKVTGITVIGKSNYLFDSDGRLVTTQLRIQGQIYYANANGTLRNGWVTVNKQKYYYNQGIRAAGLTKIGKKVYCFDKNGVMQTGLVTTREGDAYYFDAKGVQVTGWKKLDGQWYYFRLEDGKQADVQPLTERGDDWYQIEGSVYYFKNGTSLAKGYVTINGEKYYFDNNGVLQKGWFQTGSKTCYSAPETGAVGQTGFYDIEEECYYLNEKGEVQKGWKTISKEKYYFDTADGHMVTGFYAASAGKIYYLDEKGRMQTGFLSLNGKTYYLNGSGILQTGWMKQSGQWYYYAQSDGARLEYQKVDDAHLQEVPNANYQWYQVTEKEGTEDEEVKWFCLHKNTKVLTGLQTIGGYKYYFDSKGALYKGCFVLGGKHYYSDEENGAIDPKGCLLKAEQADGSISLYYYNGKGQRVTGWATVNGKKYYFSNVTGEAYMGGKYYIGNVLYSFDADGVLQVTPNIRLSSTAYRAIDVEWAPVDTAVQYLVEYSTDAEFSDAREIPVEKGMCQVSLEGLEPDTVYYIRMRFQLDGKVVNTENSGEETEIYSVYSPVKSITALGEVKAAAQSAQIEACEVIKASVENTETDAVKITAKVTGRLKSSDDSYYLVHVDAYKSRMIGSPLLEVPKDEGIQEKNQFTFELLLPLASEQELREGIMNKYALAVRSGEDKYTVISAGASVSNPEYAASCDTPYFYAASKKGIQDAGVYRTDMGTKHTLQNLYVGNIMSTEAGAGKTEYIYKGTPYYFEDKKIASMRATVQEYNEEKIAVTMVVLLNYPDSRECLELVHPSARSRGAAPYYMMNTTTQKSQEMWEAMFSYLGEVFGQDDCFVSNWILGNEVNSCRAWNYKGSLSFSEYVKGYASAFRILYYGVKQTRPSSRVFISLDNAWNRAVAGYTGKRTLDAFASYIVEENPDIDWNVAFHPYSAPLTRTEFWKSSSNTINSVSSPFISMKNLSVLTDYLETMEKTYKKEKGSIRVILSEQGWSSYRYGEKTQAEAIARAYYIAEFNTRVDAFIIRAEVDDAAEMASGLYLGMRAYKTDKKKIAYYVYKFMDTPRISNPDEDSPKLALKDYDADALWFESETNREKFRTAQSMLVNKDWETLVSGYDEEKLNQMPYAMPE